jgi:small subunit ribosomal protein S18
MIDIEDTSPAGRGSLRERSEPDEEGRLAQRQRLKRESSCRFCRDRLEYVDYKDVITLQSLCRSQGRITAGKRSGNCARHQRMVKRAIKRARFIGLMSFTESPHRVGGPGPRSW